MTNKSMGKNSVYSIIKSCSTVLFPLITFPYINRVLKPEYVGKYNFVNSIISYFIMLASLGVTTYAVRECTKCKEDKVLLSKTASQIFSINIVATVISYILLIICIITVPRFEDCHELLCIMSISMLFTTLGAEWINTAMEDFKYTTIRTMTFQALSIILMFLFVRESGDYIKYAIICLISICGSNILNIFYRKRYCSMRFTWQMDVKRHLLPILSLFAMIITQQIFTTSDTTMIGFLLGDYEVGLYTSALKIYNIVNQIITSVTWVVMPQLSLCFANRDL